MQPARSSHSPHPGRADTPVPTRANHTKSALALYTETAEHSAAQVIKEYSTSFGATTRLLSPAYRTGVTSIYALVRIADEIVDGVAAQAGLAPQAQRAALDELEKETEHAMATGFSANLVVHAFAHTARRAGIRHDLTAPFFQSMREDVDKTGYDADDLNAYIYGSAEVVGLMCLRVFLTDSTSGRRHDPQTRARLTEGARRLGAAFQKVNFLRDLADDLDTRGRDYFDLRDAFTEETKSSLVNEIADDLAAAATVIPELPRGCRAAVTAAHDLFAELNDQLRAMAADDILQQRVRVPNRRKAGILALAVMRRRPREARA
ncbi:phytoene/squalene synthase family protein [Humibacter sp. RRB41]|uniref:phytoene/squalene synthase family protein n=1 Tax=Humibacter sp. RRB41 TaxID=2919946 RepID=UPI001FA9F0AF|nr:phytoene/squalene synthase family protein [Humibacter sp. RRB41]